MKKRQLMNGYTYIRYKFIEREHIIVSRDWGWGWRWDNNKSLYRVLLWEDVEFLDVGSSNDCTTM